MTENSLITLYCIVDDFIHRFLETSAGEKKLELYYGKRRMPVADVVTLNLVRIFDHIADLKTFRKNAENHCKPYFPTLTNYENFMKASDRASVFIAAFVQCQLYLNRARCPGSVFYIDSTPVSVCENRYIPSHKVAKGVASRDKSTKGWFYGFRLHGVCTDDSRAFADITEGLEGIFVVDAGYLLKQNGLKKMYESGRKNMRRPMTRKQFLLLLKCNRIKNVWSVMKLNYNLVYHRARSVAGIFRHFFHSISAFLLHSVEDAKQWFLPNLADVTKRGF